MLRLAACLEEHFPHSMANAVVQAARDRGLSHEEMHSKVDYLVAHGIASTVGEDRVIIGSAHFVFEDEECLIPSEEQSKFDRLPNQYTHLYLAVGGTLAAVLCISDPLRPEAKQVIQASIVGDPKNGDVSQETVSALLPPLPQRWGWTPIAPKYCQRTKLTLSQRNRPKATQSSC